MSTPNITELGIPLVRHKTLHGDDLHFTKIDEYFGTPKGYLVPDTLNYPVRDKTTGLVWISVGLTKNDWQVIYGKVRSFKQYFVAGVGGQSVFTLSKKPEIDSVDVFINGQLVHETKAPNTRDFSVNYTNSQITMSGDVPEGSMVYVKYNSEEP